MEFDVSNTHNKMKEYFINHRNEIIVSIFFLTAYLTGHQINVISRHLSVATDIPTRNIGIYISKLYSLRCLLAAVGSVKEYIIHKYTSRKFCKYVSTVSFGLMVFSRLLALILLFTPLNLGLFMYMILNAEAMFFGFYQMSLISSFPQYSSIVNLTINLLGLFVYLIQFLLDLCFYSRALLIIKIHFMLCVIISVFGFGLWIMYIFYQDILFSFLNIKKNERAEIGSNLNSTFVEIHSKIGNVESKLTKLNFLLNEITKLIDKTLELISAQKPGDVSKSLKELNKKIREAELILSDGYYEKLGKGNKKQNDEYHTLVKVDNINQEVSLMDYKIGKVLETLKNKSVYEIPQKIESWSDKRKSKPISFKNESKWKAQIQKIASELKGKQKGRKGRPEKNHHDEMLKAQLKQLEDFMKVLKEDVTGVLSDLKALSDHLVDIRKKESEIERIVYRTFDRVVSPFIMIFAASVIKDFLFPGVIPFAFIERNKSHTINIVMPLIYILGSFTVYLIYDRIELFKYWDNIFNVIWSCMGPQIGVFVSSMLGIHSEIIFFNSIQRSEMRVFLMASLLIYCYSVMESVSYVAISNYVFWQSNKIDENIGLLNYYNISTILSHYLFSKFSVGYNQVRVNCRLRLPVFKLDDSIDYYRGFWIVETVKATVKDIFFDLRMNITDYL